MKPDLRVLEQNLGQLLRRSYVPVLARPLFRRRLEHLWRGEARRVGTLREAPAPRGRLLRFSATLAAAAAILVLAATAWFDAEAPIGRDELLARGEVAVRFDGADWRGLDASEMAGGIRLSGEFEIETPDSLARTDPIKDARVVSVAIGADADFIELGQRTRASFRMKDDAVVASLGAGRLWLQRESEGSSAWVIASASGALHLATGTAELASVGARDTVRLIDGRAWYEGPAGTTTLAIGSELVHVGGAPVAAVPAATTAAAPTTGRRTVEVDQTSEADQPEATSVPAVVTGLVIDAELDVPVPKFRVALLEETDGNDFHAALTRDFDTIDGFHKFHWEDIRRANYEIFVHAPGFALAKLGQHHLEDGEVIDIGTVALVRGGTIRGHVIDEATGDPVRDAFVLSEQDAPAHALTFDHGDLASIDAHLKPTDFWLPAATRSRADGSFELRNLSPGRQSLRISAPGYAPVWTKRQRIDDEGSVDGLMVALGPGATLAGHVARPDGTPWGSALLIVALMNEAAREQMNFSHVLTDENGDYRVTDLPAVPMLAILIGDPAQPSPPKVLPAMMAQGRVTVVDFRDETGKTRLFGQILDREGKPLATNLGLFPANAPPAEAESEWKATTSGPDGRYAFEALDPGQYLVVAISGRGTSIRLIDHVDVPALKEYEHNIKLGIQSISGTCTSAIAHGQAIANCVVILEAVSWDGTAVFAGTVSTDAEGAYTFASIPGGLYLITAYPTDGELGFEQSTIVTVDDAQPTHILDFEHLRGATVHVSVVDPDGRPLSGALVRFVDENDREFTFSPNPVTDAAGKHTARGFRPGPFRVEATLADHTRAMVDVTCHAGGVHHLSVVLTPQTETDGN